MKKVILYTTSGCHLCELAEEMLQVMAAEGRCQWQPVEISDNDTLIEKYGFRIPVAHKPALNQHSALEELGWPFTLNELQEWL